MPIGSRNPTPQGSPIYQGMTAGGGGVDDTGAGGGCCAPPAPTWFWQLLPAKATECSTLTGAAPPAPLPAARLDAPPGGYQYVIERAIVRSPGGGLGLYVVVGDLTIGNMVDGIFSALPDSSVMADGASAIRVPPGQALTFVWLSALNGQSARVQYRQEPV